MFSKNKNIINLTAETFQQAIKEKLTLVDFWAEWCVPCRIQSPILEEVAAEMKDKVTIAKLNVEKFRDIASHYRISSIPTMLLFRNGKMIKQFVGIQQKQTLLNTFDRMFI
ncbi:MAG TPA: thioredoxin [Bacteroidales bacterium]|jgi:thioredoxin 1|nr:thioredoxin [Bacteroidales bacterium]HPB25173.1 thioredoxin [Bacteroidales bacterium]HPI31196.1 thioredoxin [Bacteroidales bacterium]HQN15724.1 thioredoxin [Bacteroidales bacterium]HQP15286.1 thioredoxin [Bacteroidales bacterium]